MDANVTSIQRLPEALTKNGLVYRQYKRGEKAMIYAEVNSSGKPLSYEVFMIKVYPAAERFGKHYPDREGFPPNEAFGKWAWFAHSLETALEYFAALEAGERPSHRSSKEAQREEERPEVDHESIQMENKNEERIN